MSYISRFLGRKKNVWILSVASSLLLLTICYFVDNLSFRFISGHSIGQRIEQIDLLLNRSDKTPHDEYLFINIAYDRELVPVYDDFGFPMGEKDITDRSKLNTFLSKLNGSHRYVILDVLLSDRYASESDSSLVRTLLEGDRIIISRSETADLIDSSLYKISGSVDYLSHLLESNFVKYTLFNDKTPSLPFTVCNNLYHTPDLTSYGPFYFSRGHLSWKSLNLTFPVRDLRLTPSETDSLITENKILNLGSDILNSGIDVPDLVRDKIVVVGDFDKGDPHGTHLGEIAGPIINTNAIEALRNEKHIIPWSLIICLLALYSIMTYLILQNKTLKLPIVNKLISEHGVLRLLLSFVGYSFVITLIACSVYFIYGKDINVILPSLWFTILNRIVSFNHLRKPTTPNAI